MAAKNARQVALACLLALATASTLAGKRRSGAGDGGAARAGGNGGSD